MAENIDKLDMLFEKQHLLQVRLQNKDVVGNQEYINVMILALIDEAMEALRETPWKPWKKQQAFDQLKFQNEIVDAWHFLINLSLAAGFDSDTLHKAFIEKNKENHKRQDENY